MPLCILFLTLFFTGEYLLYNAMLVSADNSVNQLYIYTYISSLLAFPPSLHPTHPGHLRALSWAPCTTQKLSPGYLFYTWQYISVCVCVCVSLAIRSSLSPLSLPNQSLPFILKWVHKPLLLLRTEAHWLCKTEGWVDLLPTLDKSLLGFRTLASLPSYSFIFSVLAWCLGACTYCHWGHQ